MANMTFKANLLPNSNLGYSLGSSDLKWKINGADPDDSYVKKSGDTMTGDLRIKESSNPCLLLQNTDIDITATSMTAVKYSTLYFRDKNNESNAYVQSWQSTNGNTNLGLYARRKDENNADVVNGITLTMARNGTRTVSVSTPAGWRSAIGAVNIAGDTMTGNLTIKTSGSPTLCLQNTDMDTQAASISTTEYGALLFTDKNSSNNISAYAQVKQTTNGNVVFDLFARRRNANNNGNINNGISLGAAQDGTLTVSVSTPAGWRKAINAVNKDGDEMLGMLTFKNSTRWPGFNFKTSSATAPVAEVFWHGATASPYNIVASQYGFRQWSYSTSTPSPQPLTNYETFYLPNTTANRTSNADYSILTSKNPVTIAQGGTGATTEKDACANLFAFDLKIGTAIPSNSDLNTYTTQGSYYSSSSTISGTLTNAPTTGAGFKLVVLSNGQNTNIKQIAFHNSSTTISVRNYSGSSWTAWKVITYNDTSLFVLKAGDTMTGNLTVSTSSGGSVRALNTTKGYGVYLDSNSTVGNHGVWSTGYWDGSAFQSSGKWIIYRGTDGEAHSGMKIYGAVWNDYAEYRITKDIIEPGRCIREIGDDTLVLTTERLQKGCEIVSDTFGFAVGKTEKAKTPTAASGRVLAYLYENREIAKQHIGDPVCSGPDGTVSIMTEEEERLYPSRIIGTISSVPDYEIWHAGTQENIEKEEIKVNGRIWIRVR